MIERRKKLLILTFILFIASIALFTYARNRVESRELDYEEVKVTVISAEKKRHASSRHGYYTYHAFVEYEGERYELINVKSGELSKYQALANLSPEAQFHNPYFDNTVYYSEGKMYSNIDGIQTDSQEFNWQMAGLAAMALFGTAHYVILADYIHKKRSSKA